MPAPQIVLDLIERFDCNLTAYKSGQYNEAQVRNEFINPFFEALGWDVNNRQGYAEAYKHVIHEDAVKVGGATKAPDYSFRVGGVRKFFVEAKKPSINIKDDIGPVFQLRRYAWSAKLPLSILTDFEEFAVYDCRIKPNMADKAGIARTLYLTYKQYVEKWDEIAAIFSFEAINKGSFDRYAESHKAKKGTAEVDDAFLAEIEKWRDMLARNIALRNPSLKTRELNFSVQRTIDRLIFLRICEDRGIEDYGALRQMGNGANIYPRLRELFYKADDRYNSGLFHFRSEKDISETPDNLTLNLTIDDKPLKEILRHLYPPDSPYEFSVLPADILGQVYEQFLGKVIRLTAAHHAVVEEKPEVKKAGGVFYTPSYIVDFIVKNTVGRLLEGKTPKQAEKLRILDPACGSGSFLLGAFQYLLDWHLHWYTENDPAKWAKAKLPAIYQGYGGDWRLTTTERKRILLNNIYGVDIDSQAVEVTKLSLLLKVLEGETGETLSKQLSLFHERALPSLAKNIKCGNSLIGPDFYENKQLSLLDEEEQYRVNVFDWQYEFPEIFKAGGFDSVIGNPPWGAEFSAPELIYHRQNNQEIIVRMIDSFMYFVYQCSKKVRHQGIFGMILPDVILYQSDNQKLREYIVNYFRIYLIVNTGNVFNKVTRPTAIIIFDNANANENIINVNDISMFDKLNKATVVYEISNYDSILQKDIINLPGSLFITSDPQHYVIWSKSNKVPNVLLSNFIDKDGIQRGISPDLKEAFLVNTETIDKRNLEKEKLKKVVTGGRHVTRYFINYPDLYVIYTKNTDNFKALPNIKAYIDQYKDRITCKEVKQGKHSLYSLHRPRNEQIFLKRYKIIGVITGDKITVSIDDQQVFATDGLYLFSLSNKTDAQYLTGILNSKLFVFLYRLLSVEKGRVLAQVKPTILNQLPIRRIDFSDPVDKARYDRIVQLVEQMLALNKQIAEAKTSHEKTFIKRQIDVTDRSIDKQVYELYGLTEDEIKIVKGQEEN